MSTSAVVLTLFIGWTLALLVVMELERSRLVVSGRMRANAFTPDNANLSPFMQRLTRAHANCLEGLPVFGGLLLVALLVVTGVLGRVVGPAWGGYLYDIYGMRTPYFSAKRSTNCSSKSETSSGRSRRGGTCAGTTRSRKKRSSRS